MAAATPGWQRLFPEPCLAEFAPRGEVRRPAWSHELMASCGEPPVTATIPTA